jgi:hypothetical protein
MYWLPLRGDYRTKRPTHCDHFLIYCAPHLSYNHSRFTHQTSLLWLKQRHLVAKRRETGREVVAEFCLSVSLSCLKRSLTCRKILVHRADGFTSPPKEGVLRIFSPLEVHRSRTGLNPLKSSPIVRTTTIKPPITTKSNLTNVKKLRSSFQENCY